VGGDDANTTLASVELYDPATGAWTPTSPLTQARHTHTATLLPEGKVLVYGGRGTPPFSSPGPLSSAELYDPATGAWASTTTNLPREDHTATLLPHGKVLVVGGEAQYKFASLYIPVTRETWTPAGSLAQARYQHTATRLLPSGKVLIVGGQVDFLTPLDSAEVYDPATGTWSSTRPLAQARTEHTATRLLNGKVLVVGGSGNTGYLASAELYDPATGTWTPTGSLFQARHLHTATRLPDGKVLIVGGWGLNGPLASAELYDPATGSWTPTGQLSQGRSHHTATLLPNGKVLVAAGLGPQRELDSAEVYDPDTGKWSSTGFLKRARHQHTATLLPHGKVLVAGSSSYFSTEVYDPDTGAWTFTGELQAVREAHMAALLPSGKVLLLGGLNRTSAEVYDPATHTSHLTAGLAQSHTEGRAVLLPDGRVLVVGGRQGAELLSGAEVYEDTGIPPAWRPDLASISAPSTPLENGGLLTVNGSRLRGLSEDFPLLTLLDLERERFFALSSRDFSSTQVTAPLPPLLPGNYLLSVTVNGLSSHQLLAMEGDVTEPETTLTTTPDNPTNQATATFAFSANEANGRFECKLDGAAFTTCTSPFTYSNLSEGTHTFQVRVRDAAGNTDATPATHTWLIDLAAPAAPVITSPRNGLIVDDDTPVISGTAQARSTVSITLDGAFVGTTVSATGDWSFPLASALADGQHTVTATASDAGGVSPASAAVTFTVDTTPDTPEPTTPGGCGCATGVGDASWLLAGLALLTGAVSRRRQRGV
jgi:MYXO-CTERM domain-containing protein